MNNPDLTPMPPTGEDQDDGGPEISGWAALWAVLLGVGFVVCVTLAEIGLAPTSGLYRRLQFVFNVLGGMAITGVALAALTRRRKPKPKPPASQDLA
jgi:hypothetical protein